MKTQHEEIAATQLKVAGSDMRPVSVPVRTGTLQRKSIMKVMQRDPAKLLQALVSMDDTHADFQIMCLSAVNRKTFLLRTSPRASRTTSPGSTMLCWSGHWPQLLRGRSRSSGAGQPRRGPDRLVSAGGNVCSGQMRSAKRIYIPDREDVLALTSSAAIAGAAYINSQALALGCVLTTASTRGLTAIL